MPIFNIIEGEYDGLEDNDEFVDDSNSCSECGAAENDYQSWCQSADRYGNDNCNRRVCWECLHGQVRDTGGNPDTGIAPNGWYYDNGSGMYFCPEHNSDIIDEGSEYAGLEDNDEFEDKTNVHNLEMHDFSYNFCSHLNKRQWTPEDFSDGAKLQVRTPPHDAVVHLAVYQFVATWSDEYEGFQYSHPEDPVWRGHVWYDKDLVGVAGYHPDVIDRGIWKFIYEYGEPG